MKKVVFLLLLTLGWSGVFGQSSSKEVIYGTVRSDGYQKITTGAFWSERPEAKIIYEGGNTPSGYVVYVLEKDYYVRFVDTEHNNLDRNYIVFPKGEKVYANNISGYFYSAKCGNRIESIQPVDMVKIVEKVMEKTVFVKETTPNPTRILSSFNNTNYSTNNYYQQPQVRNVVKKRGEIKIGRIIIPVAAMAVAAIAILAKQGNTNNFTINNNPSREPTPGGPGGAPVTPPDTPPVVTPPVDPGGGPGGANTTR